ncbi:MAG: hypothetical protein FJX74_25535 [Armatimonadetes bacterium]|nr:hypothetical protein [Armatimonadota bacterium]
MALFTSPPCLRVDVNSTSLGHEQVSLSPAVWSVVSERLVPGGPWAEVVDGSDSGRDRSADRGRRAY